MSYRDVYLAAKLLRKDGCGHQLLELNDLQRAIEAAERGPQIVCLCGSTRFKQTFEEINSQLTDEGKIVLSAGSFRRDKEQLLGPQRAAELDDLHKRKIDLADEVLIVNQDGYVGSSTRAEIAYAKERGLPVSLLFPEQGVNGGRQNRG